MLACPTRGVSEVLQRFEGSRFTCEWKYDGERAQIHFLEDGDIRIYSRNQENNTSKYPDIVSRFRSWISPSADVRSAILDSEAVAWDPEKKQILPFQILSTRKRKDAAEAEIKVQVSLLRILICSFLSQQSCSYPFFIRYLFSHLICCILTENL